MVRGRRKTIALNSRPHSRRAGTSSVSAHNRAAPAICQSPHRAGRRGRARGAADRRAGPEYGTARCRRYHRSRGAPPPGRPPIGARGLNMGLRDAADITDLAARAIASGEDPGSAHVINRYDQTRRPDILSRTFVIDMANRSLLSDFLPMQWLRAAGLHLIGSIGPPRRLAMREGLAPSWRPTRRAS